MMRKKNATLAAVLSFLIAGVGHFYLGEWRRGALWLGGALVVAIILGLALPNQFWSGLVIGLFSAWDARKIALAKYS
jgi:TM2 domain-containing membrane protein YozV